VSSQLLSVFQTAINKRATYGSYIRKLNPYIWENGYIHKGDLELE